MLRSRVGITPPHSPPPDDGDANAPAPAVAEGSGSSSITPSNGHINLFADLEEHTAALAARASKSKPAVTDTDRGVALAPTKQDLNPWYSSSAPKDNDNDKTAAARRCGSLSLNFVYRESSAPELYPLPSICTDSAIWRAKSEPTRSPRSPRTSCGLLARRLRRCPHHPNATHRAAATRRHLNLSRRSRPHHPPRVRAAWHASPPSENARWPSCDASNASASAQRAPLRRRAQCTAAIQMCLTGSRWRTRIVSATARGASGDGRTTPASAGARVRSAIECLGIGYRLPCCPCIFVWFGHRCTLLELAARKTYFFSQRGAGLSEGGKKMANRPEHNSHHASPLSGTRFIPFSRFRGGRVAAIRTWALLSATKRITWNSIHDTFYHILRPHILPTAGGSRSRTTTLPPSCGAQGRRGPC